MHLSKARHPVHAMTPYNVRYQHVPKSKETRASWTARLLVGHCAQTSKTYPATLYTVRTLYTVWVGSLSQCLFYIPTVIAQTSSKEQLMRTLSSQPIKNIKLLLVLLVVCSYLHHVPSGISAYVHGAVTTTVSGHMKK